MPRRAQNCQPDAEWGPSFPSGSSVTSNYSKNHSRSHSKSDRSPKRWQKQSSTNVDQGSCQVSQSTDQQSHLSPSSQVCCFQVSSPRPQAKFQSSSASAFTFLTSVRKASMLSTSATNRSLFLFPPWFNTGVPELVPFSLGRSSCAFFHCPKVFPRPLPVALV